MLDYIEIYRNKDKKLYDNNRIDQQEYISWKLPKNWHIVLTSNPNNGEYLVNEMDDAQKTRYISVGLRFDKEEWAAWAENEGIDGRCINFVLLNPEIFDKNNKSVNPRSVCTFFNAISGIPDFNSSLDLITMIGEGSIGPEVTGLFVSFINNKLDKLITPEFIMHKDAVLVEKEIKSLVGSTNLGNYRADIASTLATRVINYSVNYAKNNKIDKPYEDRIEYLALNDMFGSDLNYHMVKTLFANSTKFKGLTQRKELTKYIIA